MHQFNMRRPGSEYAVQVPLWLVLLILGAVHMVYFKHFAAHSTTSAMHTAPLYPDTPQPAARIPRSWDNAEDQL